jgi:hypothetical protein
MSGTGTITSNSRADKGRANHRDIDDKEFKNRNAAPAAQKKEETVPVKSTKNKNEAKKQQSDDTSGETTLPENAQKVSTFKGNDIYSAPSDDGGYDNYIDVRGDITALSSTPEQLTNSDVGSGEMREEVRDAAEGNGLTADELKFHATSIGNMRNELDALKATASGENRHWLASAVGKIGKGDENRDAHITALETQIAEYEKAIIANKTTGHSADVMEAFKSAEQALATASGTTYQQEAASNKNAAMTTGLIAAVGTGVAAGATAGAAVVATKATGLAAGLLSVGVGAGTGLGLGVINGAVSYGSARLQGMGHNQAADIATKQVKDGIWNGSISGALKAVQIGAEAIKAGNAALAASMTDKLGDFSPSIREVIKGAAGATDEVATAAKEAVVSAADDAASFADDVAGAAEDTVANLNPAEKVANFFEAVSTKLDQASTAATKAIDSGIEKVGLKPAMDLVKAPGELLRQASTRLQLKAATSSNPTLKTLGFLSEKGIDLSQKVMKFGVPANITATLANKITGQVALNDEKTTSHTFVVPHESKIDQLSIEQRKALQLMGGAPEGSTVNVDVINKPLFGILPRQVAQGTVKTQAYAKDGYVPIVGGGPGFLGIEGGTNGFGLNKSGTVAAAQSHRASISQTLFGGLIRLETNAIAAGSKMVDDTTIKPTSASSKMGVRPVDASGGNKLTVGPLQLGVSTSFTPIEIGTNGAPVNLKPQHYITAAVNWNAMKVIPEFLKMAFLPAVAPSTQAINPAAKSVSSS